MNSILNLRIIVKIRGFWYTLLNYNPLFSVNYVISAQVICQGSLDFLPRHN